MMPEHSPVARAARGMPRTEGRRPVSPSDGADVAQRRQSGFGFWACFVSPRNASRPMRVTSSTCSTRLYKVLDAVEKLDVERTTGNLVQARLGRSKG
jgi:hypothetical protein